MKKILVYVLGFLYFGLSAESQSVYKQINNIINIDDSKNIIVFPTEKNEFSFLFKKLDSLIFLGEGQINILHIGGSHVQADVLSHRLRINLTHLIPGIASGRGFVFPYSIAKTNNPYNYRTTFTGKWESLRNVERNINQDIGIGGIIVSTSDSTATINIELRKNIQPQFEFNKVKVIFHSDTSSIFPVLYLNEDTLQFSSYDSITSTYLFDYHKSISEFKMGINGFDSLQRTVSIGGFLLESEQAGIRYHSIGVNGASVPSYLKCTNFEKEISLINPDLIIFGIGINDAAGTGFTQEAFENNYLELIKKFRTTNPNCAIIFITNNDSFRRSGRQYSVNRNGLLARESFYNLAKKSKAGVWDQFEIMGGLSSMREWEKAGLSQKDKIHFTTDGYILLGDLLFNAIWESYSDYLKSKTQ